VIAANNNHAARMRKALFNTASAEVQAHHDYVVRITDADGDHGRAQFGGPAALLAAIDELNRRPLDAVDSAVTEAIERGLITRRQLLHAAQRLGAPAVLGVERALREVR
jgi:hypothetical protein